MPRDHFDLIARCYNHAYTVTETMLSMGDLPTGGRLLDAGGGTGRVAAALRGLTGHAVIADTSLGMLRQAIEKDLPVTCAPVEALPFPGGSFDRIIMMDAFHHVGSQRETASELWRVLKTGGRIVIIEPNIGLFSVKLIALLEKVLMMRSHFLSASRIVALFPQAQIVLKQENHNNWVVLIKIEK